MQFFICSFQDIFKAKYFLCSAFRKEQAYRNWAEISKGIAKPVSHSSAQMGTLGEDGLGVCVNGVSERQRMVQVCTQLIQFGSLLSIGKGLRQGWLCVLPPHMGNGASQCETRISGLSTPQHLSVQGILGLGMSPVLPASLCTDINVLLIFLWRTFILGVSAPGWIPMWCKLL